MYFVYILLCADGTLYTGITTDTTRRLAEHKSGRGGHYTRSHGARRMIHVETSKNRSEASKREAAIKRLTRAEKFALKVSSGKSSSRKAAKWTRRRKTTRIGK